MLDLIANSLRRTWLRTVLMIAASTMCFLLFGLLGTVFLSLNKSVTGDDSGRVITVNRINIQQPLPVRYADEIARTEGVADVSLGVWFGGYTEQPGQQFPAFPVRGAPYLALYPEIAIDPAGRARWLDERRGVLVEQRLADEEGWQVGDAVVVNSLIWPQQDGSKAWSFTVSGIYRDDSPFGARTLLMHYDAFNEARRFGTDTVAWLVFDLVPGADVADVARRIDDRYLNSGNATRTQSEEVYQQAYLNQFGNLSQIVMILAAAGFLTSFLVLANAQALTLKERARDYAVLLTLGFRRATLALAAVGETLLTVGIGAVIGLSVAWAYIIWQPIDLGSFLPDIDFHGEVLWAALPILLLLAVLASAAPLASTFRLQIMEQLR
ncbi:hypothetical protein CCR85_13120 [Rhodothalassium salexigens]|uniref:ABC transporter permease n=1 Tax=Rhodothalassium salexigens TaxID=1086 RepID=UPI001912ED16|nr:FtsX-like permease family protein [Rhodothalassium salexigens]MBK5912427.1 hypothetical protein [Rhodothalassium salexigens]